MITTKARYLLVVIPAKAGIQRPCFSLKSERLHECHWIPAFAGMTTEILSVIEAAA